MSKINLVFSAYTSTYGAEAWITDGTASGTILLKDIYPGSTTYSGGYTSINSSFAGSFAPISSNQVVFSAQDSVNGQELWTTDGTASGTHFLKDLFTGSTTVGSSTYANSSNPSQFASIGGGKVLFSADNGTSGRELWVTDGTSSGTKFIVDLFPGTTTYNSGSSTYTMPNSSNPYYLGTINGKILIAGSSSQDTVSLYTTDLSAAGTTAIANFAGTYTSQNDSERAYPTSIVQMSANSAIFTVEKSRLVSGNSFDIKETGLQLWTTDGSSSGTKLVKDFGQISQQDPSNNYLGYGNGLSGPVNLGNGKAVLAGYDQSHGAELWVTDGTASGTLLLKDINQATTSSNNTSYPGSSSPLFITAIGGGRALFSADDGVHGQQLWTTDGTATGTYLLKNIGSGTSYDPNGNAVSTGSNPSDFKLLPNGNVIFGATDGTHGYELWITDGTSNGTRLLKDINDDTSTGPSNIYGGNSFPTDFSLIYTAETNPGNYNFKFVDAKINFVGGHEILTGPTGDMYDVTVNPVLTFSDGQINQASHSLGVDPLYYYSQNKDIYTAGIDASAHYNQYGWHEGRNPDALFSTNGYLAANRDIAVLGINPLTHYDQYGWKEGRDPSAGFDNEQYLLHNPDVKAAGLDPLAHYLQYGQAEGRQAYAAIGKAADFTHGSFDAEYYLLANPDIAKLALASGGDTFAFAYQHYVNYGAQEGRKADAFFDSAYYLAHNPDVAAAHLNPLMHYDQYGWKEGRDPSADFHTTAYLAANPDVAAAHLDPLQHYLQYGANEGRHLA